MILKILWSEWKTSVEKLGKSSKKIWTKELEKELKKESEKKQKNVGKKF